MNQAKPLPVFLGERLRWHRESRKLHQDEVAALARRWGLAWTRSVVAAIEAGRRQLSVEEFLLLPWIAANQGPEAMKGGGATPIELADFVHQNASEHIILSRRFIASDVALRAILRAETGRGGASPWFLDAHRGDLRAMGYATSAENEAIARHLWPEIYQRHHCDPEYQEARRLLEAAHAEKLGDAEGKAARRLRTFPLAVAATSRDRWGRSFTEERDRRVAAEAPPDATPRTLQALRGHVARALLQELHAAGIEGLRPKHQKAIAASWRRALARAKETPP